MMKKGSIRRAVTCLCLAATAFGAGVANASSGFDAPVNGWLVQDYPTSVALWYTPSTCVNGGVTFTSSDSQERQSRLIAMVLAAKAMGAKMHITYEVSGGSCLISDFGVLPN